MKVRDVIDLIKDVKSTQKLLMEEVRKSKETKSDPMKVVISPELAEDIDQRLDDLVELYGAMELKK